MLTITSQSHNLRQSSTSTSLSRDSTKRCYWLQHFCLMNIFQHVGKRAIIAANMHATVACNNCIWNHV